MVSIREDRRKQRLFIIERMINVAKDKKKMIDRDKLVAVICMDMGISRRTALEYINTLVDSGRIKGGLE
ncbi:MAG: hypothetical protein H8E98_04995 [Bacteroidetes bacterium]|nr:hypothetical protein [Bacteroidota bacterium]